MLIIDARTQAGYREGITAGKEEALQEGFDTGFAEHGAPSGRDVGTLRGVAAALLFYIHNTPTSMNPTSAQAERTLDPEQQAKQKPQIQAIVNELATLKLVDLLPPDLDALNHAKDHADGDGRGSAAGDADREMQEASRKWDEAQTILRDMRDRINTLAAELQLGIKV